ncbi:MAG: peptide chain release factor H [Psychromonas sp.]|nr:peptide chain release factor H [Psychromonas sp.]
MILLQLSAGQGPLECCQAVALAAKRIEQQANTEQVKLQLIESVKTEQAGFKSLLIQLEDIKQQGKAKQIACSWQGSMVWICQSPFRPKHKRKNWFFSGRVFEVDEQQLDKVVTFQACRASGAGGQHINTTDSAIRATHTKTGLSVRIDSERSQHANKRLARALLFQKLESEKLKQMSYQEKQRWLQHWQLERGNPVRTFNGRKFAEQ